MITSLPQLAESYVHATNNGDGEAFLRLFDDHCIVDDNGRVIRGLPAIKQWSDREIFAAQVSLDVLDTQMHDDQIIITTRVDGNFDRTGLADPVIIRHHIACRNGKIVGLTCRLAVEDPATP